MCTNWRCITDALEVSCPLVQREACIFVSFSSLLLLPTTYFPYFEKIKVGLCDHLAVCVSVYPPTNFWMAEPIFMKLGIHIMTPEPLSPTYFINPSNQSLYVCICIATRQRLGKHVTAATNTDATIEELLNASFSMPSVSYQWKVGNSSS
jgi:hypothetical protein